ncbi:MAG: ADP-ribosylglycohydrolase family protein [Promethearchaeota archaeon]
MRELNKKEYFNKVLGSWLGRIAGDFVGAPLEFKPYRYIRRRYKNLSYFPKKINLDYVNDDEM